MLFGRVQGAYRTVVWGAIPLGAVVGGVLAHVFGLSAVFVIAGVAMLVMAAALARVVGTHRDQLVVLPEAELAGIS
jgi:uncharacterized membrane protein YoaK (UPF0700 family)